MFDNYDLTPEGGSITLKIEHGMGDILRERLEEFKEPEGWRRTVTTPPWVVCPVGYFTYVVSFYPYYPEIDDEKLLSEWRKG